MNGSNVLKETFFSAALGKEMGLTVYLPRVYDGIRRFPVLYFMHGRSGNEDIMFNLGIPEAADRLTERGVIEPMIIVCPRLENSRGLNSSAVSGSLACANGIEINLGRYEDYFIGEVIPFIDGKFMTEALRDSRYVGGVSAGGYAALNYGFRHQDLFSKAGGHMPALELQLDEEDLPYFGTVENWEAEDPLHFALECPFLPGFKVWLDAGDMDEGGFYNGCKELYGILSGRGVDVSLHIYKGHHDLSYIKSNLDSYLGFYGHS